MIRLERNFSQDYSGLFSQKQLQKKIIFLKNIFALSLIVTHSLHVFWVFYDRCLLIMLDISSVSLSLINFLHRKYVSIYTKWAYKTRANM